MSEIDEAVVKRIMPHNYEAEQSVLGAVLIDNACIGELSEIVTDGSLFYNKSYGVIYDAMLELSKMGRAIDEVTLADKLKEMDVPETVMSEDMITNLVIAVPTSANANYYANIVYEKATLRQLIKVSEQISTDCYTGKSSLNELLEKTEKDVFKLVQKRNIGKMEPIDKVVNETLGIIEKAARTTGEVTGLATGFIDLDHMTTGFRPGNLVLIAARPAMGKTSFVLSIAKNLIINQKKPILMFSLEMSNTELVNRLLSMDSKVDSMKFKSGQLTEGDWESLIESGGNIARSKLILDDSTTSLAEIRSKCRKMKLENDIQLVIIDYLQLMNGNGKSDSRQQEVSEISRSLKMLAKELGIPIMALSQLSRSPDQRPDHRPMLSDLRESGAIEQDADVVLFIYRDEVYNKTDDNHNKAEIIIAKQRSGPTGTVQLAWLPEYTQFGNLAR